MTCAESELLIHALLDGELDAGHARDVEKHLQGCPRRAAQLAGYGEMQKAISAAQLRFAAPQSLRQRVEAALPAPTPPRRMDRRSMLKGFAMGSALSGAIAASLFIGVIGTDREQRLLGDVLSAHVRSLQGEHLTDVQSSDGHTVKPWFNGKIDVSPPVVDLTAQGFPLIGGRLDYIDGRAVACLVYRRRMHVINVFVVNKEGSQNHASKLEHMRGFNIRQWTAQGLEFLAVSDLNSEELLDFVNKFEAAIRTA